MSELIPDKEYREWIVSIKGRVQASQLKAAVAVNYAMLELYWFLGEQIIERQETVKWGDGVLKQMSKDLTTAFPDLTGFSRRNLFYMRKWVRFWRGNNSIVQQLAASSSAIVQQAAAQLPLSANSLFHKSLGATTWSSWTSLTIP